MRTCLVAAHSQASSRRTQFAAALPPARLTLGLLVDTDRGLDEAARFACATPHTLRPAWCQQVATDPRGFCTSSRTG
jgi:hypothetical protein